MGTLITALSFASFAVVALVGLAFPLVGIISIFGALFFKNEDEIIERRIREVRHTPEDFPGNVVPFERRAS